MNFSVVEFLLGALLLASSTVLQLETALPFHLVSLLWPLLVAALAACAAVAAGHAAGHGWPSAECAMDGGHSAAGRCFQNPTQLQLPEKFLLGLLLISLWPQFLGTFSILHPALAALPIFVLPIFCRPKNFNVEACLRAREFGLTEILFLFVSFASMAWGFLGVLAPPTGMDALTYHLALPDQYLIRGSIHPPALAGDYLLWHQYEMAILPLLAVDPTGVSANLMGFFIFLTAVAGAFRIGLFLGGMRAGLVAAAAVSTSPLLLNLLVLTKNDVLVCALILWGVYALLSADDRPGGLIRAALFFSGALAVKPTAAFAVLPFCWVVFRKFGIRKAWGFSLALLMFPAYWILRNLFLTGSPFPPTIHVFAPPWHSTFASAGWTAPFFRLEHLVLACFTHFSSVMDGPIGPLVLTLFLALYGTWTSAVRPLRPYAVAGLLGVMFWIFAGRSYARFLLPLFLPLAAAGAVSICSFGRRYAVLCLLAAVISMSSAVSILESEHGFLRLHAGAVSREAYIQNWLSTFRLQSDAARVLPKDSFILAVGEARLFYLHRKADFDVYWEPARALSWAHESHDPEILRKRILEKGYTHLLYAPRILQSLIEDGHPVQPCPRDKATLEAMLAACSPVVKDDQTQAAVFDVRLN